MQCVIMKPLFAYTSKEDQGWQQALKEEARSFNRDFYKDFITNSSR